MPDEDKPTYPKLTELAGGEGARQSRGQTVSRALQTIRDYGQKALAPINPALLRFGAKLGLNEDPELKAMRERERVIQLQINYMKQQEEERRLQDLANRGIRQDTDYEL